MLGRANMGRDSDNNDPLKRETSAGTDGERQARETDWLDACP